MTNFEQQIYFQTLAAWAKNVTRLYNNGEIKNLTKELVKDSKAHAAQLSAIAELLLKNTESKQPETAPFANTMLGEVPPIGNGEQSKMTAGSFMGATWAVRQNEQTVKPCPACGGDGFYRRTKRIYLGIKCSMCGGTGKALAAPAVR